MSPQCLAGLLKPNVFLSFTLCRTRLIHTSPSLLIVRSGRFRITPKRNKPLNYEDSFSPPHIAHRKSWNSWNTSTIEGGMNPSEALIDDMFIRKFIYGSFPNCLLSKVIIKRQYNIIRIAAIMKSVLNPIQLSFMIGFVEEMLSYWFHCMVKLELQIVKDPSIMIFKKV